MKTLVLGLIIGNSVFVISSYFICKLWNIKKIKFTKTHYVIAYSQGFIASFLLLNTMKMTILYMLLISIIIVLIAIDIIDSMTMIIPNGLLCILGLLVICHTLQYSSTTLIERVVGMLVVSVPMLLINRFVLEAFGGGDIKLMVVMGYFLGWKKVILTIILASLLGGVFASWLLVIKKTSSKYIPFAPYLCKSALIAMFFSDRIISWYFGNF